MDEFGSADDDERSDFYGVIQAWDEDAYYRGVKELVEYGLLAHAESGLLIP